MKTKLYFSLFLITILGFANIAQADVLTSDLNGNSIPDHEEPEVIVSTSQFLDAGEYNFQNLTITNNATLTLKGDSLSPLAFKGVKINAENITVNSGSSISADGQGYGDDGPGYTPSYTSQIIGASYGGKGGNNTDASVYGSALIPKDLGTGMSTSSKGGGAIWLNISNTLTNNGTISANAGGERTSGGSVYIQTNAIAGTGAMTAYGGRTSWPYLSWAGGGGRIAVHYNTSSYTGTAVATGGLSCFSGCNKAGGDGTVAFIDMVNNNLYIKDYFRFQTNDTFNFNTITMEEGSRADVQENASLTTNALTLRNLSVLTLANNATLNIPTVTMTGYASLYLSNTDTLNIDTLNLEDYATVSITPRLVALTLDIPNINIATHASINMSVKGHDLYEGPGAPSQETPYTTLFAGASYGGTGAANTFNGPYGSEREPVDFGSGGSSGDSYPHGGGGAIRIITENLTLNGTIYADGSKTSSGGSVYITTENFSGTGLITARGGSYYCPGSVCYRGGGGGRIAVYYENSTFTGPLDVRGGFFCTSGCYPDGGNGTVVYEQVETQCTPGTEGCNSNVLFLPGIQGSRLYEEAGAGPHYCPIDFIVADSGCLYDRELWVSTSDANHERLNLNTSGESLNDIYTIADTERLDTDTKEYGVVGEAYTINIYKSFLEDLNDWKESEDLIEDYAFIPYDWRLSLEDIVTNGKVGINNRLSYREDQEFSESYILQQLRELKETSRTGKVTLVAHSTGGLVIKALINKLQEENDPLYDDIDKIIFVAVPQVGAPEATIALLHGIKLGSGFIMDADRNRALAENMPTVYNLAPSDNYFNTVNTEVDPIVTFPDHPLFAQQTNEYGGEITTFTELKNYLLGTDGRTKPTFEDTKHANIVNEELLHQAEVVHQALDNFTPPPNTKVIQVAGWGEETKVGFKYEVKKNWLGGEYVSYKPKYVIDGDSTVPIPSALWMSDTNPNIERWYLDLWRYNDENSPDRNHKNIIEVDDVRNLILNKITENNSNDYIYITQDKNQLSTEDVIGSRIHFTLHSPLTLGITDGTNYTGLDPLTGEVKNEIPYVNYEQIGKVQFLSVPAGVPYTLKMYGYEEGSFALDVEKQIGNDVVDSTSFQGIPSSDTTIATMDIPADFAVETSELQIDNNGDNTVDKTLEATPEGITIYDTTAPEISMTFNQASRQVEYGVVDESPTTITHTESAITAMDEQGNTSILDLIKYVEKPTRTRIKFNTITRNGAQSIFPDTNIIYDWQEKNDELTDLDTIVTIKGEERYRFNYKKKANETVVRYREKGDKKATITTLPGFVSVTITTDGDELKITY